jgi:hypothetical protein
MNESVTTEAEEVEETEDVQAPEAQPKPNSRYIDFDSLEQKLGKDEAKLIQDRINEDFKKRKEIETRAERDRREKQELEARLLELEKPQVLTPPTSNDFIDDEDAANKRLEAYTASISAAKDWEQKQAQQEAKLKAQQLEVEQKRQMSFLERAKNAQIDNTRLGIAAHVVSGALPDQVSEFLVDHEYGPQIVDKLSSDTAALQELASLNAIEAGLKIEELSKQFKQRTESTSPPPVDPLSGGGSPAPGPYDSIIGGGNFFPS